MRVLFTFSFPCPLAASDAVRAPEHSASPRAQSQGPQALQQGTELARGQRLAFGVGGRGRQSHRAEAADAAAAAPDAGYPGGDGAGDRQRGRGQQRAQRRGGDHRREL